MKFLALKLFLSITAVVLVQARDHAKQYDLEKAANLFDEFVKDYHKEYKDGTDRQKHFEAFKMNLADINSRNIDNFPHAFYGIDIFADYTKEEKAKLGRTVDWRK